MNIQDWGLIPYQDALRRQFDLVDLVHRDPTRETLVLCSHPPIVTLGRGTLPGDVFGWTGATAEVNRGGRATYHGPSQIVAYAILDLTQRGRDLHRHMRALESAVVAALGEFGVVAQGRSAQVDPEGRMVDATGVWIGARKVASVGIAVRKWVAFHGVALNVEAASSAIQGFKPCGFTSETMISLEEAVCGPADRRDVQARLTRHLCATLAVPAGARVASPREL